MGQTSCRKIMLLVAVLAFAVVAGSQVARAQGNDDNYALGYFTLANTAGAPEGTLRFVNDGYNGDHSPGGDVCASIYVFDNREELQECCSCRVTPNGYLALGVNKNLTASTITGVPIHRGVIKVVTSAPPCDPTVVAPAYGIRAWLTHIEKVGSAYQVSVEDLKDSSLGGDEQNDLAEDCLVGFELGSGFGQCSCTDIGR
jgi:hypothetical protein